MSKHKLPVISNKAVQLLEQSTPAYPLTQLQVDLLSFHKQ